MGDFVHTSYEAQLKKANEIAHKQGLELAAKNKALALLGRLYEIAVLPLGPAETARRITQAIQTELDFEIVGMLGYDGTGLIPLASATSKRVSELEAIGGSYHEGHGVVPASVIHQAIETKRPAYTEKVQDICGVLVSPELCTMLEKDNFVRSSYAYPLLGEKEVQGVLVFSLNRVAADLGEYGREAMASFAAVVAIMLEKVRLYEELKHVTAQQEGLLRYISREIKGYFTTSAAAFAAIAEGDYGPVPENLGAMAKTVLADVRKGVDAVIDILDSASMKKGTFAYHKALFDLEKAVEDAVRDFRGAADEKKLALTLETGTGDFMYNGDESKIRRHIFRNVIDNAIKYTPAGSVRVSLSRQRKGFLFAVEDTGVGVTPEDMVHLFTEGGHGKDSLRANVHSTGYGLFIAKQVVAAHGGTITAHSRGTGNGSRFEVELPFA